MFLTIAPTMHSSSSHNSPESAARFDRLARTRLLAGAALDCWREARIALIGAGQIGSRLAPEIVRSGASVMMVDPEIGEVENLGTQAVKSGVAKAEAVRQACDEILPGRAEAWTMDVRHVGPGQLASCKLIVDATDDPDLTWTLALMSNGLAVPLLRAAVDGSGERELGRVAVSHGGKGHACAACSYDLADLGGSRRRQPCPGQAPRRPATLASGAIASAIVGLALHQAVRLVTGNDDGLALDHEVVVDLGSHQMLSLGLRRTEQCLTGHVAWSLVRLPCSTSDVTLVELFEVVAAQLGFEAVTLEPYGHALSTAAVCDCGTRQTVVGSRWSPRPECPACGSPMQWVCSPLIAEWTKQQAVEMGLTERSLAAIGLPSSGAMVLARNGDARPVRLVFA